MNGIDILHQLVKVIKLLKLMLIIKIEKNYMIMMLFIYPS